MKNRRKLINLLRKRQIRRKVIQHSQSKGTTPQQRYDRAMKGI